MRSDASQRPGRATASHAQPEFVLADGDASARLDGKLLTGSRCHDAGPAK